LQFRTVGIYLDHWIGRQATIRKFDCNGHTTVYLRQSRHLFPAPQIVAVNGMPYRVNGKRTITVPGCVATVHVTDTRVPGPNDTRNLGIIVDGFK
jgi:hypothetical protein